MAFVFPPPHRTPHAQKAANPSLKSPLHAPITCGCPPPVLRGGWIHPRLGMLSLWQGRLVLSMLELTQGRCQVLGWPPCWCAKPWRGGLLDSANSGRAGRGGKILAMPVAKKLKRTVVVASPIR